MKTKRKIWYLQKKDILYVEENHDGKYGAKGKERLPKRKLTPEDVQRVNAWNKSKRARLRLMEYFSPGDLWVTFTYKPENRPPDMDTAKKQFLKMMDKLRKIYRKKGRVLFWIRNIERGTKGAWHIHCIINDIGNTASLVGGGNSEYITFNYVKDGAELFADNQPVEDISLMQIHYFLPSTKDYLEAKRKIRRVILEEGGTYPDVTVLMEPDNKTRHIVFECEFENDYDMEE